MYKFFHIHLILLITAFHMTSQAVICSQHGPHFLSKEDTILGTFFRQELATLFSQKGEDPIFKLDQESREGMPLNWPKNEPWPLKEGISITRIDEFDPPIYLLSNQSEVKGCETERANIYKEKLEELIAESEKETTRLINLILDSLLNRRPDLFFPMDSAGANNARASINLNKVKEEMQKGNLSILTEDLIQKAKNHQPEPYVKCVIQHRDQVTPETQAEEVRLNLEALHLPNNTGNTYTNEPPPSYEDAMKENLEKPD